MFTYPATYVVAMGAIPYVAPTPPAPSVFEADLATYLLGLGIVAYPGQIPQEASLPAITYLVVSARRDGQLSGSDGFAELLVQFDASSTLFGDCVALAESLRLALQGYVQKPMGNTWVFSCLMGDQMTRLDPGVDGSGDGTHSKISEFTFLIRETIPTR